MRNEIKIFNNPEFGEIRTVMIEGEPWFVGKDVCQALGYADTYSGVRKNVDAEDKRGCPVGSTSGTQETTVINESGLYSLIFGSKLESAKKFKKWVTSEVLPCIRKTGVYGQAQIPQTTDGKIALLAQGHTELREEIESVRQELDDFKQDMPLLAVECDRITSAVSKRGIDSLGGKGSNAYKNNSIRGKVYRDIHRELKRQFGVTTYKAIKRNQCDLAVSIVEEYDLPLILQEQISDCNAQISMEVD
jgi:prophage antirepressor-like protein